MSAGSSILKLAKLICLIAAIGIPGHRSVVACDIPVFRYALERFPADRYHFLIYHRGPLAGEANKAVDLLKKLTEDNPSAVNFDLKVVEIDAKRPLAPKAPAEPSGKRPGELPPGDADLPWLVVTLPGVDRVAVWSAPLRAKDLPGLLDSPLRREVRSRLLKGESAVFLLLESGRTDDDTKATQLIEMAIAKMQKELKLPADDGTGQPRSELPLRIAFSVLAVPQTNASEQFLRKTLLAMADRQANDPIVFPVFGRGRILGAVSGKQLTQNTIEEAGQFLCNGCSCTLKAELPGSDLLLTADWDALLENRATEEVPSELHSLALLAEAARAATSSPASPSTKKDVAVTTSLPAVDIADVERRSPILNALLLTGAGFAALVGLLTLLLWLNRRRKEA
jgi:hypothetical protein